MLDATHAQSRRHIGACAAAVAAIWQATKIRASNLQFAMTSLSRKHSAVAASWVSEPGECKALAFIATEVFAGRRRLLID